MFPGRIDLKQTRGAGSRLRQAIGTTSSWRTNRIALWSDICLDGDPGKDPLQDRGYTIHAFSWSIFDTFLDETTSHPVGVFGAGGGIRTSIPPTVDMIVGGLSPAGDALSPFDKQSALSSF